MVEFKHDISLTGFTESEDNLFGMVADMYVFGKHVLPPVRLRSSSARVYSFDGYKLLVSYSTPVCVYDMANNNVIVGDYYSHTTAQHVCKFIADYAQPGYTRVNLYVPSNRIILHDTGTGEIWKASRKGYAYQYAPKGGDK